MNTVNEESRLYSVTKYLCGLVDLWTDWRDPQINIGTIVTKHPSFVYVVTFHSFAKLLTILVWTYWFIHIVY